MPPLKITIRLELTTAQKVLVRAATGRDVNVLELRLQSGPEPAAGPAGAAEPEILMWPDGESSPERVARHGSID
jgi:hypothetical protein